MPWLVLGNVVDESSTRLARSGRSTSKYEHGSFFYLFKLEERDDHVSDENSCWSVGTWQLLWKFPSGVNGSCSTN